MQFSRAALTKYHQLGGLKQQNCLVLLEARSPASRCWQEMLLLKAVEDNLSLSLLASGICRQFMTFLVL